MKRSRTLAVSIVAVTVVAPAAFVAWARRSSPPEPTAYAAALADPAVTVGRFGPFITIEPVQPGPARPAVGLLFYPGMRVAPEAYVAKLSAIAARGKVQIVIGRPTLNLALLAIDQADEMKRALPTATRFYVGGHSMGGAAACMYASKHRDLEGVVLFGTYCGSDISAGGLRVLTVAAERDGLFPPEKIARSRHELPATAELVVVPGMNHAQFGDYGAQSGDRPPTVSDATARDALASAAATFFSWTN